MICQSIGFDSDKLVKGRKQHLLVDTLELALIVVVTSAYEFNKAEARELFAQVKNKVSLRTNILVLLVKNVCNFYFEKFKY
ncbi:hypothetical protein [uncultured Nostoc sp.]|uniref:hypothetical protein n=1 Tax=uncultured Nostoc sp. TaxID=340711 RepID=UPI0026257A9E|nr:hypothetical protein [uncultured Nostoc sp.]